VPGDLAQNHMAVAIHVANYVASDPSTSTEHHAPPAALPIEPPTPRIDNSPVPSVGARTAAAELDDEDEQDTWRVTARNWYVDILKDTPGTGRVSSFTSRHPPSVEIARVKNFALCITLPRGGLSPLVSFVILCN
jgi:hypothetical protein